MPKMQRQGQIPETSATALRITSRHNMYVCHKSRYNKASTKGALNIMGSSTDIILSVRLLVFLMKIRTDSVPPRTGIETLLLHFQQDKAGPTYHNITDTCFTNLLLFKSKC